MMLMYHCNFGHPFLDAGCRLILPTRLVTPRDPWAKEHSGCWSCMEAPRDLEAEYVFIHDMAADAEGNTFAAIVNDTRQRGVCIRYNRRQLPYFMQWKSIASGDYVVGLEPSNSSVYGREYHEKRGDLHTLPPFGAQTVEWRIQILDGYEAIAAVEHEYARLLGKGRFDD
jgi:hypothetical protein